MHSLVVVALGIVGLAALAFRRRSLAGTTLVAAWWWAAVSLCVLSVAELAIGSRDAFWVAHLRFWAGASTLCPAMAVLGAKRPQDKAWQFIVLGLWVVAVLPSSITLVVRPGEVLDLHPAQSWFLLVLVTVGFCNAAPTRYWPSAALGAAAQVAFLDGMLPWGRLDPSGGHLLGLGLAAAAAVVWAAGWLPARRADRVLDRVWIDFRDRYGLLWGLRVAERFNAAARQCQWGVTLRWSGLEASGQEKKVAPRPTAAMVQALRNLLRRFLSDEELDSLEREGSDADAVTGLADTA